MKNLIIVARGGAAFGDVVHQNQLLTLQFANFAFIRADHSRAVRFHDAVKKLVNLLFHGGGLQLERRAALFHFLRAAVPQIAEHCGRKLHQLARRRERAHKGLQSLFYLRPRHGLAVAGACGLAAQIVGIDTTFSFGPCGGHGMVAIAAGEESTHREIRIDVLAGRRTRLARQAILNEIESLERDHPVMLSLA